jgi:hypothetical protein
MVLTHYNVTAQTPLHETTGLLASFGENFVEVGYGFFAAGGGGPGYGR